MFLFILFTSAIFHHRFLFVHFVTSPLLEFCHTLITLTFASRIIFRHHYPPFALSSVSTLVSTTDSTLFFDAPLFSSVFPLFFPLFFPPLPIRLWIFMHPRVVVPLTYSYFYFSSLFRHTFLSLSFFDLLLDLWLLHRYFLRRDHPLPFPSHVSTRPIFYGVLIFFGTTPQFVFSVFINASWAFLEKIFLPFHTWKRSAFKLYSLAGISSLSGLKVYRL